MNLFLINLLKLFSPELAHNITINFMRYPIFFKKKNLSYKSLQSSLFDIPISNPIGLAAGFDKNAVALPSLLKIGFSFIEVGTVTPKKQLGNNKPRVFRLIKNQSIINRLGFPNSGMDKVYKNIAKVRKYHPLKKEPLIGLNIGFNKDSKDPISDYLVCIKKFHNISDYITINVSSPNTPNLRSFQNPNKLNSLLSKIENLRKSIQKKSSRKIPLVLKISPDLKESDLLSIVKLTKKYDLQAIAISNTTLNKKNLIKEKNSTQEGGVSGEKLFKQSTHLQSKLYQLTKGNPIIMGVGGINSSEQALEKIYNGANVLQIYTSLVYKGPNIITNILEGINYEVFSRNLNSFKKLIGEKKID